MDGEAYSAVLRRLSALERRVSALFRTGRVAEVQLAPYRARVDIGPDDAGAPVVTDPLPVLVPRSGEVGEWDPLTVGERVAVLSPGGEDASAFVLPALVSVEFGPVSDTAGGVVRRFGALGDASAEVARIEVTRGETVASSRMRLLVGAYGLDIGGDGHLRIYRDQMDTQVPS